MEKTLLTEGELLDVFNARLREYDVCDDVRVVSIYANFDPKAETNWDVGVIRGSGTPVVPDCKRAIIAVKYDLQRQYNLFTDA